MQRQSTRRPTGHVKVIERNSGPVFYLKTRVPGRVPEQTTTRLGPAWTKRGRCPEGSYTRRMADEALAEFLADARRGAGAATDRPTATFADACAEFLRFVETERAREVSTVADYRGVVDGYLVPRWGERDVASITWEEVDAYKRELLEEGRLSSRTIVRHLMVLHGVFKQAMKRWKLATNPASSELVERPPVRYSLEFESLDGEHLAAIVRAAPTTQEGTLYLTAAWTGLRLGELLALRWRDVDWTAQRVHVRRSLGRAGEKAPKSGRVRSVPMMEGLMTALARLGEREHFTDAGDLVFCSEVGDHLNAWTLRRRFYAALETAGLGHLRGEDRERKFVFHDLRHVFGSTAVRTFPLSDVQALLGHAHITTTMRYVHHRPGADDARRLEEAFGVSDRVEAGIAA